jgi:uncharacterized protein YkwD
MWRLLALAAVCAAGCLPARRPFAPRATAPLVRHGPDRLALDYPDPRAAEKRALFDRINRDRAANGVPPVRYEPRGALVGDRFCLEAAVAGSRGHFDLAGRAPYLRWALAGGVDFHAQNAAMYAVSSGRIDRPLVEVMLLMHDAMMAETPPRDGHRRTILDPDHTHVGIGLGAAGGELRMSQEFTAAAFEWVEVPAHALAAGDWAAFRGLPRPEWEVGQVEIRFEPAPRPLTRGELRRRESYGYPPVARTLRPRLPEAVRYEGGGTGEIEADKYGISFQFPLDRGPGHYYVLCLVHPAGRPRDPMRPATAALVVAR